MPARRRARPDEGAARAGLATLGLATLALGCGHGRTWPDPSAAATGPTPTPTLPPVVATERGAGGGVLVLIDERGDRQAELLSEVTTPQAPVRDTGAAYSPDGEWIVFASSRGQGALEHSALWLAPARAGATPVQLSPGPADLAPAWTADGQALVFSRVEHGDADLWQQRLVLTPAPHLVGEPRPIALGVDHQLSPTVAGDGRIAYARVGVDADGQAQSRIHLVDLTGHDVALTAGPGDSGPRFAPDGAALVFSRPTVRAPAAGAAPHVDADLWIRDGDGAERRLWDLPGTDEGGPVFSVDGRWLFATSVAHGTDGSVVLASIVYADLWDRSGTVRMLRDRAGVWTRMSPALAPVVLDSAALAAGPPYQAELRRAIVRAAAAAATR